MFKFRHKDTVYFRWGLTAFLTVIAILAVYDIIFGPHKLAGYLGLLGGVITPVLYGCAIAYLLAPIVDFLHEKKKPFLEFQDKMTAEYLDHYQAFYNKILANE